MWRLFITVESSLDGSGVIQSQKIALEPDFVAPKPSKTAKNHENRPENRWNSSFKKSGACGTLGDQSGGPPGWSWSHLELWKSFVDRLRRAKTFKNLRKTLFLTYVEVIYHCGVKPRWSWSHSEPKIASEPDFVTSEPSKTFKKPSKTLFLTFLKVVHQSGVKIGSIEVVWRLLEASLADFVTTKPLKTFE